MTSATHHPYEIPKRIKRDNENKNIDKETQINKYLFLVNQIDNMLKILVTGLKEISEKQGRDLLVIVTGDHGEAFGDHGGYQHDNIYWEEGLHVPFVVWSPNRIKPGQIVRTNRSLIDMAPTILDIAGIPYKEDSFDGRTVLKLEKNPVKRYFACWYSNVCVGFVKNFTKLVYFPNSRSWMTYDLNLDPSEQNPIIEPEKYRKDVMKIKKWYNSHRHSSNGLKWKDRSFYNLWHCNGEKHKCKYSGLKK